MYHQRWNRKKIIATNNISHSVFGSVLHKNRGFGFDFGYVTTLLLMTRGN